MLINVQKITFPNKIFVKVKNNFFKKKNVLFIVLIVIIKQKMVVFNVIKVTYKLMDIVVKKIMFYKVKDVKQDVMQIIM